MRPQSGPSFCREAQAYRETVDQNQQQFGIISVNPIKPA